MSSVEGSIGPVAAAVAGALDAASAAPAAPGHVVLLGDSIFDNGPYVRGGPDVAAQLRTVLPSGWRVTLLARDGDVCRGVPDQLKRLPSDATLIVVSMGGNDALGHTHLLEGRASSVGQALGQLVPVRQQFSKRYADTLDEVLAAAHGVPVATCTIYDGNHAEPTHSVLVAGLCLFNDAITRASYSRRVPVIDLRLLCNKPADYANPIEPSTQGGQKIAQAIARLALLLKQHVPPAPSSASDYVSFEASVVIAHTQAPAPSHGRTGCVIS